MALNKTNQAVPATTGEVIKGSFTVHQGNKQDGKIYDFGGNNKLYLKFTSASYDQGTTCHKTGQHLDGETMLNRLILSGDKKTLAVKREKISIPGANPFTINPWVLKMAEAGGKGRSLILSKVEILTAEGEALYKKNKGLPEDYRSNSNFRSTQIAYFSHWDTSVVLKIDVHGDLVKKLAKTGITARRSATEASYLAI